MPRGARRDRQDVRMSGKQPRLVVAWSASNVLLGVECIRLTRMLVSSRWACLRTACSRPVYLLSCAASLHTTHDEMKDKPFELELSWLTEETGWQHKPVPKELM